MAKFQPIKKQMNSDKTVISIRIEESKLEKIDQLAMKTDISRNELINQCIEYALNNLEFKDKKDNLQNENSSL